MGAAMSLKRLGGDASRGLCLDALNVGFWDKLTFSNFNSYTDTIPYDSTQLNTVNSDVIK